MTKIKKYLPYFSLALLLVFTLMIFSLSFDSAIESDEKSEDVTRFLQTICDFLKLDIEPVENTVRKAAHFIEFTLLGALAFLTSRSFGFGWSPAMLYSIVIATLDETIQIYSPGRSSSTMDVLLDSFGALFGILCFYLILKLTKKKK